jgi:hypothetical protein
LQGVSTPVYRKDSWEVDWNKRSGKRVWARNPISKMREARQWHWIDHSTLDQAGVKWKPYKITGRCINSRGYVILTRRGMSEKDIEIVNQCDLWLGTRKIGVAEHRLVAAKKYGAEIKGKIVRHLNGIKTDNRPENLILGTVGQNNLDHDSARKMAIYWRERCLAAEAQLKMVQSGDALRTIEAALTKFGERG